MVSEIELYGRHGRMRSPMSCEEVRYPLGGPHWQSLASFWEEARTSDWQVPTFPPYLDVGGSCGIARAVRVGSRRGDEQRCRRFETAGAAGGVVICVEGTSQTPRSTARKGRRVVVAGSG